jgi:hypothetical protein
MFFRSKKMTTCKECRFYKPHQAGEAVATYGYCFLKPPGIVVMPQRVATPKVQSRFAPPANQEQENVTLQPISVRPAVQEHEYCGDWKAGQTH